MPALRAGAELAGWPVPRLVAMVPVALRAASRHPEELVLHSNSVHLQQSHYLDMLRRGRG